MRTMMVGLIAVLLLTLPLAASAAPAAEAGSGLHRLQDWLTSLLGWMGSGFGGGGSQGGPGIGSHVDPHGLGAPGAAGSGTGGEDPEIGPAMDPNGLGARGTGAGSGTGGVGPERGPAMDPNG